MRSIELGETFHPVTGPWVEANVLHVNQQRLVERSKGLRKFVIWDVGLGAGANILAAIEALRDSETEIEIHSFDRTTAPLEFAISHSRELVYPVPYTEILQHLLHKNQVNPAPRMSWQLHLGDFREQVQKSLPAPHAILYDPYSAATNRDMWSLDHFQNLRKCLDPDVPCLLTNYTRSTAVRVTLLLAGFYVGAGCEIGQKAETTVASNHLDLLNHPLDRKWVERIKNSTHSAPIRVDAPLVGPMKSEEYEVLQKLPQFER